MSTFFNLKCSNNFILLSIHRIVFTSSNFYGTLPRKIWGKKCKTYVGVKCVHLHLIHWVFPFMQRCGVQMYFYFLFFFVLLNAITFYVMHRLFLPFICNCVKNKFTGTGLLQTNFGICYLLAIYRNVSNASDIMGSYTPTKVIQRWLIYHCQNIYKIYLFCSTAVTTAGYYFVLQFH